MNGGFSTPTVSWDERTSSHDMFFLSPSKLNLFFRVLRKREDGFHEIASLFQAIDLCDKLAVSRSSKDKLTCSDPHLACDGTNLIIKALNVFRKNTHILDAVDMHLEKNVPLQAGLGGGSANAATALFALNELFGRPARESELVDWSKEIGSDVPFFFSKGCAYCTGRGEILEEVVMPWRPERLWVAKPQFGLSTPAVFKECRPEEALPRDPRASLLNILSGKAEFYNDLELPAFKAAPQLGPIKSALLSLGFSTVVMTGSGTSFFCLGGIDEPMLEGVDFFRVQFLGRNEGSWYKYINVCYI